MSFQGLAAFGLGAMQGYQNQNKENKREAERLADKDYQRSREKDQDGRVAAAEGRAVAAEGRAVQQFGMQQEASQITLDEARLQNQINAGLRKATQAYSMGDKSGAFAALQETGNSLYPNMQMKFDQDEQGNIIVDANGAATGQRFTAQGVPIGQKITMKPEQAHQSLYAAMNPTKYVENQAAAAAEATKAEREWQMHQQKGLFDARLGVATHGEKRQIDSQYGRQDKAYETELGIYRDNNTSQNNIYRDSVKPQTTASGTAKAQLVPALRGGSSGGQYASPLPNSLIGTESGGNFGASNNARGHGGRNGHFGRAQFGHGRIEDMQKAGVLPKDMTPEQFMASPDLQLAAEQWQSEKLNNWIDSNPSVRALIGKTVNGHTVTRNGLIAMAHLGGETGAKRYIDSGFNSKYDVGDDNKTKLSGYLRTHSLGEAQDGAVSNLRQNEGVAAAVANNLKIISGDLSKQLKDNDVTISPAKIQAALGIAGRSLVEMSRKTNAADQQKAFRAAMDHIKIGLLGSMTDLSDAEKEVYAQQILSQVLGESSDQSMNNLVFNAEGQALAAVNAKMNPAPATADQGNPFEGGTGVPAPATAAKPAAGNLYPDAAGLTDAQRAAVSKNMFGMTVPSEKSNPLIRSN